MQDPETGEMVDAINDKLLEDMKALAAGKETDTLRFIDASLVSARTAVPAYYDRRYEENFANALRDDPEFSGFTEMAIGDMVANGFLEVRGGHGSPKQEQRVGDIPYIKVSDLRAGTVNINPTNRVPRSVAERLFWRGKSSGLAAFDLVCPERTSKNIGDFCVLMPGQEQLVVTKEVIVVRPGPNAYFDPFYLLWAFTLKIVRDQWKRVIFMQTNREDVGKRYFEIRMPIPPNAEVAERVSQRFRDYYVTMARARQSLTEYLAESNKHHFFIDGGEALAIDDEDEAILAGEAAVDRTESEPDS
ncbi:hypothetical protein O7623_13235 [Solwaraspora sp. WMMD791]|uniref:hypothetical protein n=1 Tax=Solwaraspora sp. WMMD791 TaxID=3016086 RepID=UPI00249CAA18|nr:hypothetical protein [Solwaraspora sp. WMMD791]WFE30083.1 hypothetical protein O7623_13235 [Solwaraspora sp. WMMD791]